MKHFLKTKDKHTLSPLEGLLLYFQYGSGYTTPQRPYRA